MLWRFERTLSGGSLDDPGGLRELSGGSLDEVSWRL